MIEIKLQFTTIQDAANFLATHAPTSVVTTGNLYAEAAANKPKSTKVSAAEKSAVANITAEQQAAVDDTAGLEEQNAGKPVPAADTKPTAVAAKADVPEQKAKPSVEYPVLQKAVFDLAAKSREAVMEVAATFGVKTFKELSADRYAEALEAVKAKHASLTEEVA